ncbi:Phosphotransferase enzyme family [Aspergillus sp. HF37]|nr:Phosphotransferase enzyme family [Aspergillus sp. HF37]
MFDRIFGRKSHETHSVRGVEIDRPVIGSRNVPSRSFSSNGSSHEGSPSPSDRHPWYRPPRREQVRRRPRPAPLQQESLTVNRANDWSLINADGSSDVSPVRRAGAVRHPVNPLTRRRQTFSGLDVQPDRQEDNRAAVSRSDAVRHQVNPLTDHRQSEPLRRAGGLGPDGTHVDLSTPFMPAQPHPPPRSQVRRSGAVRHAENPLTARRQNFPRDANHAQHRHASATTTPVSPSHVVYPGDLSPDEIRLLPLRLKSWINVGMTACDIGRYAAQLPDDRDKFLRNLITLLIDSEAPYTNIGRAVLKVLDIRDDTTNEPLHGKLPPGFKELEPRRPLFTHDHVRSSHNPIQGLKHSNPQQPSPFQHGNSQPGLPPHLHHPQPIRSQAQRMPFFADDAHLDQFLHGEDDHSDGDTDAEIASPRSSPGIVQLKPGPERRVRFANAADIIPPGGGVPQPAEVEWAPESWSRGAENGFRSRARQLTGSASASSSGSGSRDLMLEFQAELERNPQADLMSMFSDSYRHEHRNSQYHKLSHAAKINLRTLHELRDTLKNEPEANLLSKIPKNYNRGITMATGPKVLPHAEKDMPKEQGSEFRTRLDLAETATVVFPLSEKVAALLAQYSRGSSNHEPGDTKKALTVSLKQLLWNSQKLWESPVRGVVVKCNEDIVAKVVLGNRDYTEYTTMQFLAERAPNIPAPRAHGLIAFGPFRVIFMSYVPGIALAQAWPSLSRDGKLSIQQQLEEIFCQLRSLRQDDVKALGGVCGEGAKELRVDECTLFKGITTIREFSDLQFSASHHGSNTYVKLLRSLLEHDNSNSIHGPPVFTHGDVRTDNIMVKQDPSINGHFIITGIIDWEDSGFYPVYYECTTLTRTLSLVDEDDWYLYLPRSISPSKFPIRWLVDRLWGIHIRTV